VQVYLYYPGVPAAGYLTIFAFLIFSRCC